MQKIRLIEARTAMQNTLDILIELTTGHELRNVHGISTRRLIEARDELKKIIEELNN